MSPQIKLKWRGQDFTSYFYVFGSSHWARRDVRPEYSPAESNLASSYRAVAGWKSNW